MTGTWAWPVHGLRHPATPDFSGWYVWSGELHEDTDFFHPWHVTHLIEACPAVKRFLHLDPGFRFLLTLDYEDVWFDETLLHID